MTSAVTTTLHNDGADRCVKVIRRSDGNFGFREFRRDPEDAGGWTLVGDSRQASYAAEKQATAAARSEVGWLRDNASPAKDQCR